MLKEEAPPVADGASSHAPAIAVPTEETKVDITDVILDCSAMVFIDAVGVSTIQQVHSY